MIRQKIEYKHMLCLRAICPVVCIVHHVAPSCFLKRIAPRDNTTKMMSNLEQIKKRVLNLSLAHQLRNLLGFLVLSRSSWILRVHFWIWCEWCLCQTWESCTSKKKLFYWPLLYKSVKCVMAALRRIYLVPEHLCCICTAWVLYNTIICYALDWSYW